MASCRPGGPLGRVPGNEPRTRPREGVRSLVDAAERCLDAGDDDRAARLFECAVEDAAPGPARAELLVRLARLRLYDRGAESARAVLDRALAEAGGEPHLTARIRRAMFCATSQEDAAAVHAHAALEAARAAKDPALLAQCLSAAAWSDFSLGKGVRADLWRRALDLEGSMANLPILMWPSSDYAVALMCSDSLDEARAILESLSLRASERPDETALPSLLARLAELAIWQGDFERAAALATRGHRAAIDRGQERMCAELMCARALADAHLGRLDEARERGAEALARARREPGTGVIVMAHHLLGFIELAAGALDAARDHFRRAVDVLAPMEVRDPGVYRVLPDYVEVLVRLGDLSDAEAVLRPFERRARKVGRVWALATGARCRGLLRAARGDAAGSLRSMEAALRQHDRLGMPFELGRTLLAIGQIRRKDGQKCRAREALAEALAIFERADSPPWATRARAEIGRIGGRVAKPWDLTDSECRVASLAAGGRRNKEIAAELFLSVRTVENALSHSYHKLGVRSRTELALAMSPTSGVRDVRSR